MKVTCSWIIYSCLIFGIGILCDRKLERRQAVSSRSKNFDDKFTCSNGRTIEWSLLCDGNKNCLDGSDETKELCALYEFETNMTMDCGRVHNMKNQVTPEDGNHSISALAPWTVAVFKKNDAVSYIRYDFLFSGSIIAPNIVISWGFFFWYSGEQYDLFKIGPMVNELKDLKLLIDITKIYTTAHFTGHEDSYEGQKTISVIVLANKLLLSNGYAPICIDWFSKYDIRKKTQMRIIGYKYSGDKQEIDVIQYYTNYRNVTDETFSIKIHTVYDSNSRDIVPGSGLDILYSNRYFLTGIFTFERKIIQKKPVQTIMQFINIKYHVPWIRGILNKHVTVNSCVLPTVEGVIYSYEGSNKILSHGTFIDHQLNVTENCENGYHKASRYSFRVCLGKGKWLSSSDKLCFNKCPSLESDSLDIKCTYNGEYANCSNPSIPDTLAIPLCKPLYTAANGHEKESLELLCQPNGTWNKELFRCNPNCGKNYTINNGMIMGGEPARTAGSAPWNVGVYRFNVTFSNNYQMICGGSIISPRLVISAAHCFWEKGMLSNKISVNDDLYKIAVGKYSRNITIIDNEFTKIMNVETIYLNEYYYGYNGFHADDISIIVLRKRTSYSLGVLPICVDWIGINTIPNGAKGKIVGWGKTEKDIASPFLLEASLPYIDHSTCRKMYTNGFESYVTKDKFCAGSALGQGVHDGDSGAGLSFLHSNLYYLTGLASVKDPNSSIAVFTEINHHIQWIRRLYDKHN